MGLYIKGLQLPKKGRYTSITIYSDGRVVYRFGGDPVGQAIPVPPHERLISAFDTVKTLCDKGLYMHAEIVSDMPTVIPADPPKEETE